MAEDLIRYDILVQEALRGIVRKVLSEVARTGLPGDHHFYISFETHAPGVQVSNRVRSKYPKEMTIVLQHQFWDLVVTENSFDIGLSFGGVPEHLHVPFKAVKGFFDPEVQFNLQFEPYRSDDDKKVEGDDEQGVGATLMSVVGENEAVADNTEDAVTAIAEAQDVDDEDKPEVPEDDIQDGEEPAENLPVDEDEEDPSSADVVSLDSFRKKP